MKARLNFFLRKSAAQNLRTRCQSDMNMIRKVIVPAHLKLFPKELHAEYLFANADVDFEPSLAAVRPDSVVKIEKAIYIVEFKYAQSADAALAQCREKRYADAYAADGRRVVYVGVNYDPAARTIDAVKTELAL